jgi:hypothetical protein
MESTGKWGEPTLRMSRIGVPDRKLWYEMHPDTSQEHVEIDPATQIKFLYGHLLEELVLFLCKEAEHDVSGEQDELIIDDIVGHRDCKIDNVTVDVKSASRFSFQKFSTGSLHKDDPFGYIAQLSGYVQADPTSEDYGAFLAINKESGELTLLVIDEIDMIDAEQRVQDVKSLITEPTPPSSKCYPVRPIGKSGNEAVSIACTFCPHMKECWSDANDGKGLRSFKYSTRIEHLTKVVVEPKVEEL